MIIENTEFFPMKYKIKGETMDMSDKFLISKSGSIYSITSKKILKQNIHKKGHARINLSYNGTGLDVKIHTAMAYSFLDLGSYDDSFSVIHKDKDKTNNVLDNLEIKKITAINSENGGSNRKVLKCNETGRIFRSIAEVDDWLGLKDHGRTVREYLDGHLPSIGKYSFIKVNK